MVYFDVRGVTVEVYSTQRPYAEAPPTGRMGPELHLAVFSSIIQARLSPLWALRLAVPTTAATPVSNGHTVCGHTPLNFVDFGVSFYASAAEPWQGKMLAYFINLIGTSQIGPAKTIQGPIHLDTLCLPEGAPRGLRGLHPRHPLHFVGYKCCALRLQILRLLKLLRRVNKTNNQHALLCLRAFYNHKAFSSALHPIPLLVSPPLQPRFTSVFTIAAIPPYLDFGMDGEGCQRPLLLHSAP